MYFGSELEIAFNVKNKSKHFEKTFYQSSTPKNTRFSIIQNKDKNRAWFNVFLCTVFPNHSRHILPPPPPPTYFPSLCSCMVPHHQNEKHHCQQSFAFLLLDDRTYKLFLIHLRLANTYYIYFVVEQRSTFNKDVSQTLFSCRISKSPPDHFFRTIYLYEQRLVGVNIEQYGSSGSLTYVGPELLVTHQYVSAQSVSCPCVPHAEQGSFRVPYLINRGRKLREN